MLNQHILTITLFTPLVGALLVALAPRGSGAARWIALVITLFTFAFTLHLPAHFHYGQQGFQYEENVPWIAVPTINYHLGVDGLSMWLVVLTGLLAPVGVVASWSVVTEKSKEFYLLFLVQQTAMLGTFLSLDLFLYYGFWELSLVPMAILIAMFGRSNGTAAAIKFFVYTFVPSAPLLVAILWIYAKTGTFDFIQLKAALASDLLPERQLFWVALAFLVAFAVKVPVFPLHGWLADTFREAPTAMAMVVAGKLGLYSMLRFNLGLFPAQARHVAPVMVALAVIGILYGACMALVQTDMKRLVAFSTISHLSFCVLGIFTFAIAGLNGAVYQILNHGVSAGAWFLLLGFLYQRYGTYDMSRYGGLAAHLPWLATLFVITSLSLVGLPMLNGFVGEFLILSSSFGVYSGWATVATVGVILSAAYMLWMVQKIFYGPQSAMVSGDSPADLGGREHIALWPLALLMLVMGIASPWWMRAIDQGNNPLIQPPAKTLSAETTAGGVL